jgi:DNA-binding CsgD family transcriptional regulator
LHVTPLPNSSEAALAEAIRLCASPGFPAAMFAFLQRATDADNLVILAYRRSGPPLVLYKSAKGPQVFSQIETTYSGGAYLLDPLYELHLAQAPAGVYRLTDVAPDAFQRSRYFNEYYRQTTLLDEMGFLAYPRPGVSLTLCLGRDATSGAAFKPRAIETCHRIGPIVVALAERHWADLPDLRTEAPDTPARIISALQDQRDIRLSPRQAEVALLILRGHSSASIALRLGVSAQTVKVFRRQIYSRCAISSQAELFALMLPMLGGKTG